MHKTINNNQQPNLFFSISTECLESTCYLQDADLVLHMDMNFLVATNFWVCKNQTIFFVIRGYNEAVSISTQESCNNEKILLDILLTMTLLRGYFTNIFKGLLWKWGYVSVIIQNFIFLTFFFLVGRIGMFTKQE